MEKLLEFLLSIIDKILPFYVIPQYEQGVRLRLGKSTGVLSGGFHWKIPFADEIMTHMVVVTTLNLSEQSVTTKDNRSVVVAAVIKYEVSKVEELLLNVGDPIDALSDVSKGIVRNEITRRNWSECNGSELLEDINKEVKKKAKQWGITVKEVTLTDLGEIMSLRLFNNNNLFN